jgi:hypothetical protein
VLLAGGRTTAGKRLPQPTLRTDSAGVATLRLAAAGSW